MNKVIICQELRLSSQRLPKKILEELGGRPLISIGLEKLRTIALGSDIPVCVAAWSGDDEIFQWADAYHLSVIERSERSANGDKWEDIYDGWQVAFSQFDTVLFVNLVCHPFMTIGTIRSLYDQATICGHPWVTAQVERGQVWAVDRAPLLPSGTLLSSRTGPVYRRPTHVALCCPVADLFYSQRVLNPLPMCLGIPKLELFDIDTQEDLDLARLVYAGLVDQGKARRDPRS